VVKKQGGNKEQFINKIKEITIVLAAIATIITSIVGYINWAWVKDNPLIVVSILAGIAITIILVKKFLSICKFLKWLLTKYYKFIWKIIGMEKRFEEENIRWEIKFEKTKKQFEILKNPFYHFLKEKYPPNSTINIEISIKSGTFKKTETGYECNSDDYGKCRNKIEIFDEDKFEITALEYLLSIPYKSLDSWTCDKDGKINLYLNRAVVLYPGKGLRLEDLDKAL
jgi:hypothetical protein